MWRSELGRLRASNRQRLEQVRLEDASLIRRISGRLYIAQLGMFEREIVEQELLDMAEEAEAQSKSLQQELGMSAEEFCGSVLENCRPARWTERLLGAMIHLATFSSFFCLMGPIFWAMSYDGFELRQRLTGEDLGLQGPDVMLFPLWPLVAMVVWMVLLELGEQFWGPRLAVRRYGRAISIGLCVAWWVVCIVGLNWYEDWPYVSQTMLAIPIMPLVTGDRRLSPCSTSFIGQPSIAAPKNTTGEKRRIAPAVAGAHPAMNPAPTKALSCFHSHARNQGRKKLKKEEGKLPQPPRGGRKNPRKRSEPAAHPAMEAPSAALSLPLALTPPPGAGGGKKGRLTGPQAVGRIRGSEASPRATQPMEAPSAASSLPLALTPPPEAGGGGPRGNMVPP